MDVTRTEFQDLVGAYALDACDAQEAAALDAYLAGHPDAAAEAERLRDAAAWLGAAGALKPPATLRDRLLAVAAQRVDSLPPVEALQRETARFDALLDTLTEPDFDVVTYNGLTVRELVAHVAITDEAFVTDAETSAGRFIGADEVERITRAELAAAADLSFEQVRDRWRRARQALIDLDGRLTAQARVGGYSLASVLVIRAFETWTHLDDIADALGRATRPVEASVLRTMAELAIQTMPIALAARGFEYPGRTARIVMTGAGGGDWTIACTPHETPGPVPHVVIRVPVVEICRRFADRLAADDVPCEIEGDVELARALVDSAPAFAGL